LLHFPQYERNFILLGNHARVVEILLSKVIVLVGVIVLFYCQQKNFLDSGACGQN